jgi:membrane associated rhomboid family serine protease
MQKAASTPDLFRIKCFDRWLFFIPLFTIAISIAQVVCFYAIQPSSGHKLGLLVPCPPNQWYRTLTNMFAHIDNTHLWINVGSTLILGSIIEVRNGFIRIAPIWYLSAFVGTAFQSLISSRPVRILGSSGGVYALLAALLSELIMNWKEIRYRWLYLSLFVLIFTLEIVLLSLDPQPNIAYGAHFFGAFYGFTIGLCLVKNWRWRRHEYLVFFLALLCAVGVFVTIVGLLPRIFE